MTLLRIGVMGGSSFARRIMVPALQESGVARVVAVASRSGETARTWARELGCDGVEGYDKLVNRDDLDAIYMPLPTGLHAEWGPQVLASGKHLLVEKSAACSLPDAQNLVSVAQRQGLLVMENFHFLVHAQWARIRSFMDSGELGQVHLVRSTFGFPPLPKENFRWNPSLGGGALLDAGAYVAKLSQALLGTGLEVCGAVLQMDAETGVDRYGEAMFRNAQGQVAQVAFGFDYFYQCRVELLGTRGKLSADRIFTAKPDVEPRFWLETTEAPHEEKLPSDDAYVKMWRYFADQVVSGEYQRERDLLVDQARLLDAIRRLAKREGSI